MAATIKIKNSSTAGAAPTASDLVQGELAVNVTDKRLYTENASGTIVELGTNPSVPVTFPDGSASAPSLTNDGDTNTGLFFPAADTVGIATGGSERARVDSSGNLGLGVTPSAWGSAFKSFSFGSQAALATDSGVTSDLLLNAYQNGSGWIYKANGYATLLRQESGAYKFFNSASGTAGNAITFTQAMTLDASGNLGIGVTSPSARIETVSTTAGVRASYDASNGGFIEMKNNGTVNALVCSYYGAGSYQPLAFFVGGSERARIDSSGNLLMGRTDNPNSVSGCMYSVGTYNNTSGVSANVAINAFGLFVRATSSLKYKKNVQDASFGLEDVLKLRAVTYQGSSVTDTEQVYGGLIAEEVHEAGLTEFVQYAEDGTPDALAYGNMVSLCIKAIQELKAIVDAQAAEIAALKG